MGESEPHHISSTHEPSVAEARVLGVDAEGVRILPVSMVVIGLILLGGFLIAATSMIAAVVAADGNGMPDLEHLALPSSVEIVDSHATCDASECDGYGVVVIGDGTRPARTIDLVQSRLRSVGWAQRDCGDDVCMRRDGLAVVMRPWVDVPETEAIALRSALDNSGVDQDRLVYVLYHRCSDLHPCP
jgi:hypothetical protein